MPSIEHVAAQLNAFRPDPTTGNDSARLQEIVEGLRRFPRRLEAVPVIFALIERFPNADLGSPGPLVRELESMGGYQQELRSSLRRLPTMLTLWMVNRILNSRLPSEERSAWLTELRACTSHPLASITGKSEASEFLQHQASREHGA